MTQQSECADTGIPGKTGEGGPRSPSLRPRSPSLRPPPPVYPDRGVHARRRQSVDPARRAGLEVQAVHRLLVVPGYFASNDFHPPES